MQKMFTIFSMLYIVTHVLLLIYFIEQDLDTIILERAGIIVTLLILAWTLASSLYGFRKKRS